MTKLRQLSVYPSAADGGTLSVAAGGAAGDGTQRDGLPSRAFVLLLKLAGLSAFPGWPGHIWSGLLYALQTGMTFRLLDLSLRKFTHLRDVGQPFFAALFSSNFVAAPNLVQWAALTVCFVWGRRGYDTLLSQVSAALADIAKLPSVSMKGRRAHHAGELMWALILILVAGYAVNGGFDVAHACRKGTAVQCAIKLGDIVSFGYIYLALQLLVMKFIFVGLMLNSGFLEINGELEMVTERGCEEEHLLEVGRLQRRLTELFNRLSSSMTAELVFVMTYGILIEIVLTLMVVNLPSLEAASLLRPLMYLSAALVCVAGPCETCQLLVARLGDCRDLLLQLEWRRPQLAAPSQQLERSVCRDQETLGDLGLFSARRSTLLSISSTIVTYIIVMTQFQTTE